MQVTLFKALKSANVGDDEATAVVEQLALHMESVANNNVRAIEGRIAGVEAKLDSKMNFMMAVIALMPGLGPLLAKLVH